MNALGKVYILESPHSDDIHAGICEGKGLQHALELSKVPCRYTQVESIAAFQAEMDAIARDLGPLDRQAKSLPLFHISCHGNEDGICLTSGEWVPWMLLRDLLRSVAVKTNRINRSGDGLAVLTMSVCYGASAHKMFSLEPGKNPVMAIIGPNQPILWQDGLVAFTVFYHQTCNKNALPPVSLEAATVASGVGSGVLELWMCGPPRW